MKNFFLKAKHWQLFLLLVILPSVIQFSIIAWHIIQIVTQPFGKPIETPEIMRFVPFILLLFIVIYFVWIWSTAMGLQPKVPNGIKMKVRKFKIFFFIPFIYFSTFITLYFLFAPNLQSPQPPSITLLLTLFAIFIPLHLFSMFCILYSLYFIAKTIKTIELQRPVELGECIGDFFLLWFYIVGIWLLQPRINRIANE